MSDQQLLDTWRQQLEVETLTWREEPRPRAEQREQVRAQRQRERTRRDRRVFGETAWGVSAKHRESGTRETLLEQNGLPVIRSELELAKWLGVSLGRLRYFTHDNPADSTWHYVRYVIPKRRGGPRVILAPKTELKSLQRKILHGILDQVKPHHAAHGFVAGRSIASNALPHVARAFVLHLDLKDFFPTITFPRVRGVFIRLGYSFPVASVLALLCTEYDRLRYQHDDKACWISTGSRMLVQGAPTSPALANLTVWTLDQRLRRLASMRHFSYTRYADDLTFSGDRLDTLRYILRETQKIVVEEGFAINQEKTRILRRSNRQTVTGLVVNDKVNTPRRVRRQLRAIFHNAAQTGLAAQNRDGRPDFRAYLRGMIGFIAQTNPVEAGRLSSTLRALEQIAGG
jgi:RNA-directed DNA polymerase